MAKLTLRTPWTSQPQTPVGVDWSNPLTRGLLALFSPFYGEKELITNAALVKGTAAPQSGVGLKGKSWKNTGLALGSSSNQYWTAPKIYTAGRTELTQFALFESFDAPSTSGFGGVFFEGDHCGFQFHHVAIGNQNTFQIRDTTPATVGAKFGAPAANTVYLWVGTSSGGTMRAYTNGTLTSSASVGAVATPTNSRLLSRDGGYNWNGQIYLAGYYSRALSDKEVASLWVNPWQLFAPIKRTIWAPAAAGGTNTYTLAVSGGFSLGGTAQYNRIRNSQVSAGISFAGSGSIKRTRVAQISGGVTFGGSAPITFVPFSGSIYTLAVSGGFSLGGTASYNRVRVAQVSAGINFGGTAQYSRVRISQISGGVTFGGTNSIIFIPAGGAINIPQRTIVGAGT